MKILFKADYVPMKDSKKLESIIYAISLNDLYRSDEK